MTTDVDQPRVLKVIDFQKHDWPRGALVRRSANWQRGMSLHGRPQVGIITDFQIYPDSRGIPVSWPVIAWEGVTTGPSMVHPANVEFFRAKLRKATWFMDMVE